MLFAGPVEMDDREQTTQKAIINFVSCVNEKDAAAVTPKKKKKKTFPQNPPAAVSFKKSQDDDILLYQILFKFFNFRIPQKKGGTASL